MTPLVAPGIVENAPIPTWFDVGGRADALLDVLREEDLRRGLELDPTARILGDGANLLVDDDGVGGLVLAMRGYDAVEFRPGGVVIAQAGASLPNLVVESVRLGLAGLEGLGGIPATVGGAAVMNAGGAFGQIADVITRVFAFDRVGRAVTLERDRIAFGYRTSGLERYVLSRVEMRLTPGDAASLRADLKRVMEYKKQSQPMAARSAGCCFKNPVVPRDIPADDGSPLATAGQRVPAGLLIDRAGLKGLRVRGAVVSQRHANFLVPDKGAMARDVIDLIAEVRRRVFDRFGVALETEVVIWRRG